MENIFDKKNIGELADIMNEKGLEEIVIESDDNKLVLKAKRPCPPPMGMPVAAAPAQPVIQQINGDVTAGAGKPVSGKVIKSPIVGTFYAAPAPGKPAFATVGSKITKGSVICIVESMKLMNEITSEFDGTVAEIYVADGEAVEFDQPLMRVE